MNIKNVLVVSVLAIGFSSCSVKVAEDSSEKAAGSIEGTWSTNCMADGNSSYIKMYAIQAGSMMVSFAAYYYTGDRFCNAANLETTIIETGTLTETGDGAISGAKNFELKLSGLFLAPGSNNSAAGLNAGTACGFNDWTKDTAKLVFGCFAPGAFDVSQVNPTTTHFGIFKIETAVTPNYVQFGSDCAVAGYEYICPTALDRPATLDGAVYYKR